MPRKGGCVTQISVTPIYRYIEDDDDEYVYRTLYVVRYVVRILCICTIFLSNDFLVHSSYTYAIRTPHVRFVGGYT